MTSPASPRRSACCAIEDPAPRADRLYEFSHATERVAAAVAEAKTQGIVLTARCENFVRGNPDLGDTISRLAAFVEAGAEVIYPTGLVNVDDIAAVAAVISAPMNILTMPKAPSVEVLTGLGVCRISIGGALAWAPLAGLGAAVDQLLDAGVYDFATGSFEARPLSREARTKMLSPEG